MLRSSAKGKCVLISVPRDLVTFDLAQPTTSVRGALLARYLQYRQIVSTSSFSSSASSFSSSASSHHRSRSASWLDTTSTPRSAAVRARLRIPTADAYQTRRLSAAAVSTKERCDELNEEERPSSPTEIEPGPERSRTNTTESLSPPPLPVSLQLPPTSSSPPHARTKRAIPLQLSDTKPNQSPSRTSGVQSIAQDEGVTILQHNLREIGRNRVKASRPILQAIIRTTFDNEGDTASPVRAWLRSTEGLNQLLRAAGRGGDFKLVEEILEGSKSQNLGPPSLKDEVGRARAETRWRNIITMTDGLSDLEPSVAAQRMRAFIEVNQVGRAISTFADQESELANHRLALTYLMESHLLMRNIDRAEWVRKRLIDLNWARGKPFMGALSRGIRSLGLVPELETTLLRDFQKHPLSLNVLNPLLRMRSYNQPAKELSTVLQHYRFDPPGTAPENKDDNRPTADIRTYTILLNLCGRCRNLAGIRQVWSGMTMAGLISQIDSFVVAGLIRGLLHVNKVEMAKSVLVNVLEGRGDEWCIPHNVKLTTECFNPMIARAVSTDIRRGQTTSSNVNGRDSGGQIGLALPGLGSDHVGALFQMMKRANVSPDSGTIDAITTGLKRFAVGSPLFVGQVKAELLRALPVAQDTLGSVPAAQSKGVTAGVLELAPLADRLEGIFERYRFMPKPQQIFSDLLSSNLPLTADRVHAIVQRYNSAREFRLAEETVIAAHKIGLNPTPAIWQSLLGGLLSRTKKATVVQSLLERLAKHGLAPGQDVYTSVGAYLITKRQFRLADEFMEIALLLLQHVDTLTLSVAFNAKIRNGNIPAGINMLRLAENVPFDRMLVDSMEKVVYWLEDPRRVSEKNAAGTGTGPRKAGAARLFTLEQNKTFANELRELAIIKMTGEVSQNALPGKLERKKQILVKLLKRNWSETTEKETETRQKSVDVDSG